MSIWSGAFDTFILQGNTPRRNQRRNQTEELTWRGTPPVSLSGSTQTSAWQTEPETTQVTQMWSVPKTLHAERRPI